MGFYIRKSISAGPFRFNLSNSGVGMSVGVKGLRVGTGPRGNYVHMGRGGIYYRASLGGGRGSRPSQSQPPSQGAAYGAVTVEAGNVLEMVPSNGSDLLQQINEKMSTMRLWPWVMGLGGALSFYAGSMPGDHHPGLAVLFLTFVGIVIAGRWDQSRRTVVVLYDLADDVAERFRVFCEAFDVVGKAARIWNVETAASTSDWKRNAGASRLITRKVTNFTDAAPVVLKTNVPVPCIRGGRQTLHFLPDAVLVIEGGKAGALSYEQFDVQWNRTIFIETDGVPHDSRVVGHTWRFVNKNGGPDRRFNNNRQIPEVEYQQMGMQGGGGLRKLLQLSKVEDRTSFDAALMGLRQMTRALALTPSGEQKAALTQDDPDQDEGRKPLLIGVGVMLVSVIAIGLYFVPQAPAIGDQREVSVASAQADKRLPVSAEVPQKPIEPVVEDPLVGQIYRGPGNSGSYASDEQRITTDFFRDLEREDGDAAAQFVIADARERGPLSAAALHAKFSGLQEPLHLDNVSAVSGGRVRALYSYMPTSGLHCVGRALVSVTVEADEYLIKSLRSREACR